MFGIFFVKEMFGCLLKDTRDLLAFQVDSYCCVCNIWVQHAQVSVAAEIFMREAKSAYGIHENSIPQWMNYAEKETKL